MLLLRSGTEIIRKVDDIKVSLTFLCLYILWSVYNVVNIAIACNNFCPIGYSDIKKRRIDTASPPPRGGGGALPFFKRLGLKEIFWQKNHQLP